MRDTVEDAQCAIELPYLSPHPHQTRGNVDRGARLPRYLDRTLCRIPPIPSCKHA